MGLDDRDYMRRDRGRQPFSPSRRTLRTMLARGRFALWLAWRRLTGR